MIISHEKSPTLPFQLTLVPLFLLCKCYIITSTNEIIVSFSFVMSNFYEKYSCTPFSSCNIIFLDPLNFDLLKNPAGSTSCSCHKAKHKKHAYLWIFIFNANIVSCDVSQTNSCCFNFQCKDFHHSIFLKFFFLLDKSACF